MSLKTLEGLLGIEFCTGTQSFDDDLRTRLLNANIDVSEASYVFKSHNINVERAGVGLRWEYVIKILYCLLKNAEELKDLVVSVRHQKIFKSALEFTISLGIYPSLLPGIGIPLYKRCKHADKLTMEEIGTVSKYFRLTTCIEVILILWKIEFVKKIIFSSFLCDVLASLIQLCFAPLKKPYSETSEITPELWNQLQIDRQKYRLIFDEMVTITYQPLIIQELMMIQASTSPRPPLFLKKTLAIELSKRLMASGGLINLIKCFVDSMLFDSGSQWQQIDLISRLVTVNHTEGFIDNMCHQIIDLIDSSNSSYNAVCASCIVSLFEKHQHNPAVQSVCQNLFRPLLLSALQNGNKSPGVLLLPAADVEHRLMLIHHCFTLPTSSLNWIFLNDVIYSIFQIFTKTKNNDSFKFFICEIIDKYILSLQPDEVNQYLHLMFLGKMKDKSKLVLFCNFEEFNNRVQIKGSSEPYNHPLECTLEGVLNLIELSKSKTLGIIIFKYSLDALCYFEDIITAPSEGFSEVAEDCNDLLDWHSGCHMVLLNLLEKLSSSKDVIDSFKSSPTCIVSFLKCFFDKAIHPRKVSKQSNEECLMIALVLLTTVLSDNREDLNVKRLCEPLTESMLCIEKTTKSLEVKLLIKECLHLISEEKPKVKCSKSKLEAALDLLYDPVLPVRAHGLMEISKLIRERDPESVSKKHYLLCIFQENLKNDDSYMYLTAINGLSDLANVCTEDVLDMLTKEYLTVENKTLATNGEIKMSAEIRMKVGEVLVKVTKSLGEVAPVHKTMLLNTFLDSCKDSDFLIRASALSNLAEVCRVLSYKLGTIVSEILMCIWSIIETDKSPECRRAAVLVTSSLLKGLGKDALMFLKEDLLPLYRSLKRIYSDCNEEDVIRLHAQIALEELNACVRESLFPEVKIEKRIFLLEEP